MSFTCLLFTKARREYPFQIWVPELFFFSSNLKLQFYKTSEPGLGHCNKLRVKISNQLNYNRKTTVTITDWAALIVIVSKSDGSVLYECCSKNSQNLVFQGEDHEVYVCQHLLPPAYSTSMYMLQDILEKANKQPSA